MGSSVGDGSEGERERDWRLKTGQEAPMNECPAGENRGGTRVHD